MTIPTRVIFKGKQFAVALVHDYFNYATLRMHLMVCAKDFLPCFSLFHYLCEE